MIERLFPSIALRRERMRLQIAEAIAERKATEIIIEGIPTFARDRDEDEWTTGFPYNREPQQYSELELNQMYDHVLNLSFHPGARGLLDTMETFVIGNDTHTSPSPNSEEVANYWKGWVKTAKWDLRNKEMFRRYLRDGDVFLRWFKPEGLTRGLRGGEPLFPILRFVSPKEIRNPEGKGGWGHHTFGIETNPDDVETVLNYYRCFYYRKDAMEINPVEKWEQIPAEEIDHFKCLVDSDIKRGRSWLMGVGKYITMHEGWLDQRWDLNRIRNLFAVIGNVKGVASNSLDTLKRKFTDTEGRTRTGEGTPKKMPRNALFLMSKGIDYDLKALNINASDAADDGRNFQLLTCVGTSLPEYVVRGDASNANFASTAVSESPMVKMFEKYQDIVSCMFETVYQRVISFGIEYGFIPSEVTYTNEDGKSEKRPPCLDCQTEFPPLIHRNIKEETDAVTLHRNNGWVSDQTASGRFGYDYKQEKEQIAREDGEARARAAGQDQENY